MLRLHWPRKNHLGTAEHFVWLWRCWYGWLASDCDLSSELSSSLLSWGHFDRGGVWFQPYPLLYNWFWSTAVKIFWKLETFQKINVESFRVRARLGLHRQACFESVCIAVCASVQCGSTDICEAWNPWSSIDAVKGIGNGKQLLHVSIFCVGWLLDALLEWCMH